MGSHFAPRRRIWQLPPDGFRELRRSCLLSRKACADLLGCSLSAVRAWDRGTHRVPWSAVKLLRLYCLGDLGALRPEWRGWSIGRNGLVSPEGYAYQRGDLGWWSLTCRQAEIWRQEHARQRAAGAERAAPAKSAAVDLAAERSLEAPAVAGDLPEAATPPHPLPAALGPSGAVCEGVATGGKAGERAALAGKPGAGERSEPPPGAGLVPFVNKYTAQVLLFRSGAGSGGSVQAGTEGRGGDKSDLAGGAP